MPTKRSVIELDMDKLEDILQRVEAQELRAEDYETIRTLIESYVGLYFAVGDKNASIARLRKLLFGAKTEKTAAVIGSAKDASSLPAEDAAAPVASTAANAHKAAQTPGKGHGRNGAEAYTGAEKVVVSHASLQPGDPCPKCEVGTIYETSRPGVLVRLLGQSPIQAKIYELQKLRCNLCSEIFTAQAPAGIGAEKYDATAGSIVALLKYGSGTPFHRMEGLQANLGVPLPASTQWDIVNAKAEAIEPAFGELIRQAADGEVVFNDDTTVKILAMMGDRAKAEALEEDSLGEGAQASSEKKKSNRRGLFTSGIVSTRESRKIALFLSGRQHAGENLRDVLLHRAKSLSAPIQMCDALSRNLPADLETIVAHCLAHGRRQFVEVAEQFPEECRYVLESFSVVYHNDAIARDRKLSPSARRHFHQLESGPTMEQLHLWLVRQLEDRLVERNSSLGKAISYLLRHWERLTLFLRVPGAPLDNNTCERALKKAILHRKNALFYKTGHGAHVGDIYMSLIHTCELGEVNPFDYLTELERHADELISRPQDWLPWSYRQTLARAST